MTTERLLSKLAAIMQPGVGSCPRHLDKAIEALSFMSWVISLRLCSLMLLKTPGKAKELFIWFQKSLRPLPQMYAPCCLASSGRISGVGLANAKMMGLSFIFWIHSPLRAPAADTPINTSDLSMTAERSPFSLFLLMSSAISFLDLFMPSTRPLQMDPFVSHRMMLLAPQESSSLAMVMPAAPAPFITILMLSTVLLTTLRALIRAARTTIAVPCWSSWNTGSSFLSLRPASTSKHSGALMSQRLTARKLPILLAIDSTSSWVVFLGYMQNGTTSTSPSSLNSKDLPSMTGSPAAGPMSPKPRMDVPSVTITDSLLVLLQTWGSLTISPRVQSLKYWDSSAKLCLLFTILILPEYWRWNSLAFSFKSAPLNTKGEALMFLRK